MNLMARRVYNRGLQQPHKCAAPHASGGLRFAPAGTTHLRPLLRLACPLLERVKLHGARLKLQLRDLQALLQLHHLQAQRKGQGGYISEQLHASADDRMCAACQAAKT